MELNNQRINCTVRSCKYNDKDYNVCELKQIIVKACSNCSNGIPQDESMCGSYSHKN